MYNCNTDSLGLILGVEVFFSEGHCSGALWWTINFRWWLWLVWWELWWKSRKPTSWNPCPSSASIWSGTECTRSARQMIRGRRQHSARDSYGNGISRQIWSFINIHLHSIHSQGLLKRSNLQVCISHEYPCVSLPRSSRGLSTNCEHFKLATKTNVCPLFHQVFARVLNKYSPDTGTPGWMILYPGPDFSETHLSCCFR